MAAKQPPVALQNVLLPAEDVRRFISATMGGRSGVVGLNDLVVSQTATPSMAVLVDSGGVFLAGGEVTYQGMYFGENRGAVTVTIDAADVTNARIDLVIIRVRDQVYSGALDTLVIEVLKGTPAGTPVEPTTTGTYLILARVDVAANATSITNAVITDRRTTGPTGRAAALGAPIITTSTNLPTTNLSEGMLVYCTDTDRVIYWSGSAWRGLGHGAGVNQDVRFYTGSVTNGAATTMTAIITQNAIMNAPYPVRMLVDCSGDVGGNGAANTAAVDITDGSGVNIVHTGMSISAGVVQFQTNQADERRSWSLVGYKDYTAGQSMGFRVRYNVNTSTIYVGCLAIVRFIPLTS